MKSLQKPCTIAHGFWAVPAVGYFVQLSTIKDWDLLHQRHFCLMKMNFTVAVAPPFVHPMTSLPATPTYAVWKYGFFSEPAQWRQIAKYTT